MSFGMHVLHARVFLQQGGFRPSTYGQSAHDRVSVLLKSLEIPTGRKADDQLYTTSVDDRR